MNENLEISTKPHVLWHTELVAAKPFSSIFKNFIKAETKSEEAQLIQENKDTFQELCFKFDKQNYEFGE